jgi:hypothetical protein
VARDLPPQEQQRYAHDHVARNDDAVVERVAVVDRRERLRQAERDHDDTEHLHHGRQPEHPIVGVVGRREPRVAQPRPAHGERCEREAADARADVVLRDVVRHLVRRGAERDDDRQVVEQLERSGDAMLLVRVAAAEPAPVVRAIVGLKRCHRGGFCRLARSG